MDCKEIVREYLARNGYDGLSGEECGCGLEDLAPCSDDMGCCVPGHRVECGGEDCQYGGGCSYHMVPGRPPGHRERVGVPLIAAERRRQVEGEGWSDSNDDQYEDGELAWAAVCYAAPEAIYYKARRRGFRDPWPWADEWTKQAKGHGRRRQLVIAGALIAAELDRMERAERNKK